MSGAAKFTPGPWAVMPEECDKPYVRIRGTHLGQRYKIANVVTPTYDGAPKREAEETRANAHLIAAAPEMVSIIQRFIALPSGAWHPERHAAEEAELMRDARAALAKARGES